MKTPREEKLEKTVESQNELIRSLNHIVQTLETRYEIAEQRRIMAEASAVKWWMLVCPLVVGVCIGGLACLHWMGK